MNLGLEKKAALVTGASAGIGFAVARGLAAEGASVAIVSRDASRIEAAALRIREETGAQVVAIAGDLSRPDEPARIVDSAARILGGLDLLVTNAGGPVPGNFGDVGAQDFAAAIELTLRSVERLARAAIPFMKTRGGDAS